MEANRFVKVACACISFAISASMLSGQDKSANANEQAAKVHSQLWHGNDEGKTIPQRLAKTEGDLTIINDNDRNENDYAHQIQPAYPPLRMVEFACMSDAVVVGTPVSGGVSHMTADLSFVYSEWKFQITSVLEDNPKSPISGSIQVVRAGGTLTINGRKVVGKEWDFPAFQPGDEYLLYLKYLPETGSYKAIAGRSFDLSHGSVPNAPYMDRSHDKVPVDEVLRDAKAAISAAGTAAYCGKAVNQ